MEGFIIMVLCLPLKPRPEMYVSEHEDPSGGNGGVSNSVLFETHILSGHKVEGNLSKLKVIVSWVGEWE